jgi:hypothetical protein
MNAAHPASWAAIAKASHILADNHEAYVNCVQAAQATGAGNSAQLLWRQNDPIEGAETAVFGRSSVG